MAHLAHLLPSWLIPFPLWLHSSFFLGNSTLAAVTLTVFNPADRLVLLEQLLCHCTIDMALELTTKTLKLFPTISLEILFNGVLRKLAQRRDLKRIDESIRYLRPLLNPGVVDTLIRIIVDIFHTEKDTKQAELFVGLMTSNASKVEMFIVMGKLRNAYLLAVKEGLLAEVIRIKTAAMQCDPQQLTIVKICEGYIREREGSDAVVLS